MMMICQRPPLSPGRCCQWQTDDCRLLLHSAMCRPQIFQLQRLGQSFMGEVPYFSKYSSPKTECNISRGKPVCKNQLDLCSRFDTIPACDRQTDRQTDTDKESQAILLTLARNGKTAPNQWKVIICTVIKTIYSYTAICTSLVLVGWMGRVHPPPPIMTSHIASRWAIVVDELSVGYIYWVRH